jgi:hypothetical protein
MAIGVFEIGNGNSYGINRLSTLKFRQCKKGSLLIRSCLSVRKGGGVISRVPLPKIAKVLGSDGLRFAKGKH